MNFADRPNRFPWPPVLTLVLFLAGLASRLLIPDLRILPGQVFVGAAVALFGVGLILWAFRTFAREKSNILPHRAADKLITAGPFGLSRNPIYAGEVIALLGVGLALGAAGMIAAGIVLAVLVDRLAIRREEAHLALRFPEAWRSYSARVRRWL